MKHKLTLTSMTKISLKKSDRMFEKDKGRYKKLVL